jgi:Spy/CpxP family protein refolding chaperone
MFALFLAHSLAFAAPPSPPPPPGDYDGGGSAYDAGESSRPESEEDGMMRRWTQIAQDLGLDDKQRDSIQKLYYESRMARVDLQAKEERARIDLERLMMADTLDEKAVLKAFDTQAAATTELRRNRLQLQLGIRKALTPEQWQELSAMRESRRPLGGQRNGGGNGMGMGIGRQPMGGSGGNMPTPPNPPEQ